MKREYHRWYSPSLSRDMEMLVFGHAGARVLCFPTSKGKFYEWEDRGMMGALSDHLENGWLQVYCVDSVDAESWYNWGAHPGQRAYRHAQYDSYLYNEVLPFTRSMNGNPFLITLGASFGAYHAMTFGLKHPESTGRILAFSGFFDICSFTGGYTDDNVYYNAPMDFIPNEHDDERLDKMRAIDIIIATGRDDRLIEQARRMSGVLWGKGIGNALREWDGWSHDWPYWSKMLLMYIGGHD
jgi:esterase/lipase superfamily enzyme